MCAVLACTSMPGLQAGLGAWNRQGSARKAPPKGPTLILGMEPHSSGKVPVRPVSKPTYRVCNGMVHDHKTRFNPHGLSNM